MTKKIFKKDKKGNVKIKTKTDRFLAIILKQNKSISFQWVSLDQDSFRVAGNAYFTVSEGMHLGKNRLLMGVYLEGISTPIGHRNIKRKTEKRLIKMEDGKEELVDVETIEGLKYDSEIIDILLNRGLAEKFTQVPPDKTIFVLFVLVIINIICTLASIGVQFR